MTLLQELSEHFGVGRPELLRIIATAPARYKVYDIPKRRGGDRRIAQPSAELKALQRYILEVKLSALPIHDAATAYRTGIGIAQNAMRHREGDAILKLDFTNFFPSLKVADWVRFVNQNDDAAALRDDIAFLNKILFWGEVRRSVIPRSLSIGAPTSPALSNILMYDLDCQFADAADAANLTYTRYADDISVSGRSIENLLAFEVNVRAILRACRSPRLSLNEDKRGLYTKGQRRMITGLILTPDKKVSLGRDRKKELLALVHRSSLGQLEPERRGYLKGMLGFANAVEPAFLSRLRQKYGDQALNDALSYRVPKRRREQD